MAREQDNDTATLYREFNLLGTQIHIPDGKATYTAKAADGSTLAVTPLGSIGELSSEDGAAISIALPNNDATVETYIEESQLEALYKGLRGQFEEDTSD